MNLVDFFATEDLAIGAATFPGIGVTAGTISATNFNSTGWGALRQLYNVVADAEYLPLELGTAADPKVTVGFALARTALGQSAPILQFAGTDGTVHVTMRQRPDDTVDFVLGASTSVTVLGSIPAAVFAPQVVYVEVTLVVNGTTGSLVVDVDGANQINLSGIDTSMGGVDAVGAVRLGGGVGPSNVPFAFGHFYLLSGSTGVLPDRLGVCRVRAGTSSLQGFHTEWTGTKNDIDDWTLTDGITSTVNGQRESVTWPATDIVAQGSSVFAVKHSILAQDLGTPGDGLIEIGQRSAGGVEVYAAPVQPAVAGDGIAEFFFDDPATGTSWAPGAPGRTALDGTQAVYRSVIA